MAKNCDGEDGPVARNFRAVHLWECVPAFTGPKKSGVAVAALTLVTDEAVILPFRLECNEVSQLIEKLVGVLRHVQHPGTQELLERMVADTTSSGPAWQGPQRRDPSWGIVSFEGPLTGDAGVTDYERRPRQSVGGLPKTGVTIRVRYKMDSPPVEHDVFGGYRSGIRLMLMYRWMGGKPPSPSDSVMRIELPDKMKVECGVVDQFLRPADWRKFGSLEDGAEFKIEGTTWEKLSLRQLRRLVANKVFVVSY